MFLFTFTFIDRGTLFVFTFFGLWRMNPRTTQHKPANTITQNTKKHTNTHTHTRQEQKKTTKRANRCSVSHRPLHVPDGSVIERVLPHGHIEARGQRAEPVHGLVRDVAVRTLPRRHKDVGEEGRPQSRLGQ